MEYINYYHWLCKDAARITHATSLAQRNNLVNDLLNTTPDYICGIRLWQQSTNKRFRKQATTTLKYLYKLIACERKMAAGTIEYYQGCGRAYLICTKIERSNADFCKQQGE